MKNKTDIHLGSFSVRNPGLGNKYINKNIKRNIDKNAQSPVGDVPPPIRYSLPLPSGAIWCLNVWIFQYKLLLKKVLNDFVRLSFLLCHKVRWITTSFLAK